MMNAIETQDLSRAFGARIVVDGLTLAIPAGTVFGFLGPNGAGKTTTVRMLAALIAPTKGSATIGGYILGADNDAIRRLIGILTETPGLYDRISAWQNLLFFAELYEMPEKQAKTQVERYLRMLELWDRRNDKVGGFSKGMRQKLAIARAFLHEPAIVFLDEPTAGLDPEAARTVLDFVKDLRAEGRTIFLTTHNLPEADEVCDLIGIFKGRLLRLDTPQKLRTGLFGHGTLVQIANDAAAFVTAVTALSFVQKAAAQNGLLSVQLDDPDEQNPVLVQALVEAGARIRSVGAIDHTLEEVYMELVGNNDHEERA